MLLKYITLAQYFSKTKISRQNVQHFHFKNVLFGDGFPFHHFVFLFIYIFIKFFTLCNLYLLTIK